MTSRWNRALVAVVVGATATLGGAAASEHHASAAFLEIGGDAGILRRNLADTQYKADFAWQLHAEIAFIPSILMVGPYFGMQTAQPEIPSANTPNTVKFMDAGVRAKVRLPLFGPLVPYGVVGVGLVHGNFPDQTVPLCTSYAGQTACAGSTTVPNATANFVEIPVGLGLAIQLADELALNLEGDWRPTIGYKNDAYETALANAQNTGSTTPPNPSRNGYAFSAMAGLSLTF